MNGFTIMANSRPRSEPGATTPQPKRTTPPTPDPAALMAIRGATGIARSRFHECAHAVAAAQLDVPVGVIVAYGAGAGAQARHEETDPHRTAVIALASVVVGELGGWDDDHGPSGDLEVALAAARQLDPDDAKAVYGRLEAEARTLVTGHLGAIVRLASVLEDFGGRLAGEEVEDALRFALQRPSPRPRPGPRGEAAEVLERFTRDRRAWQAVLIAALEDPDEQAGIVAFWQADQLARAQTPPPARPTPSNS